MALFAGTIKLKTLSRFCFTKVLLPESVARKQFVPIQMFSTKNSSESKLFPPPLLSSGHNAYMHKLKTICHLFTSFHICFTDLKLFDDHLVMSSPDLTSIKFHYFWLRDHCKQVIVLIKIILSEIDPVSTGKLK